MDACPRQTNPSQHRPFPPAQYHSVEFALDAPFPVYQFRLWRSEQDGLFVLVKDTSALVPWLKVGHIVPMQYRSGSRMAHPEIRPTRILRIITERKGRFRGHHRVELAIIAPEHTGTVQ